MEVRVKLKYLRIAPRKVRLVADLVRGKRAEEAQTILNFTTKKAAQPLLKLLNSALASARNNLQLEAANLYVSEISVDEGPKLKRWMARARGQASEIQKKTSHVNLVLQELSGAAKPKKKKTSQKGVAAKIPEKPEKAERTAKAQKPKFRPAKESSKPVSQRGIKKIFRRKTA